MKMKVFENDDVDIVLIFPSEVSSDANPKMPVIAAFSSANFPRVVLTKNILYVFRLNMQ